MPCWGLSGRTVAAGRRPGAARAPGGDRVQQRQLIEAQRALEESRDRYADLYDFAPVALVTLDRSGVIQEANLAAAALLPSSVPA